MSNRNRPQLTNFCEWALLRVRLPNSVESPVPLRVIPRRILAVKVHGMGDAVMVRSLLENLRRRRPELEIGVMASPVTREVMSLNSGFKVHNYDQKDLGVIAMARTMTELRRSRYDAVINFEQGSLAGTAFLAASGIPVRIGFLPLNGNAKAAFLTQAVRFQESDSMWTSLIRLVRVLDSGFPPNPSVVPLPLSEEAKQSTRRWLRKNGWTRERRLIVFHIGSGKGQPFRRWPVTKFVELAEHYRANSPDMALVLTGTPYEKQLLDEFLTSYAGNAIDASELGTIERTAAVLTEADLLVSNDTGVMHLGAAMGTPTVGIFGPDTPERYAPVGVRATSVCAKGVPCSPCSNIYRLQVPSDCRSPERIRCLLNVTVEDVVVATRRVVASDWFAEPHKAVAVD
jgi:lipopolysaccharide heptosyltransferase II